MSKLKVTFDSDASAEAFATKWKLSTPAGNSIDIEWHLAEDAVKDPTASTHEQLDTDEREFIVKGVRAEIDALDGSAVEEDLGNGFFKVKSTSGVELAKAVTGIDVSDTPVTFLGTSTLNSLNSADSAIDPTSAEGQWARIRVASTYRPLASSYAMHDTTYLSKPELYIMDTGVDTTHAEFTGTDLECSQFWCLPGVWETGDQFGHGTAVASMAVGKNLGITDNVKLKTIKIQGKESDNVTLADDAPTVTATIAQLGEALDLLEQAVAADPLTTRILNVSWGVTRSSFLDSKFESLMSAGVTVIAAAGNSGINVDLVTPAGIDGCLTVGAIDKYDIPAGYNNISPSDSGLETSSGSATAMKETIMTTATKNALLFEDTTFSDIQNNLGFVFTADPLASYKNSDMVSYLGVSQDEDIVIDLNSNIDNVIWKAVYPDDLFVYSLSFLNPDIEAKYGEYVSIDSATGIITVSPATGVTLPSETKLEMVEFTGRAASSRVTIDTNTIFYFNSNPDHTDTLNADVSLALSDVNSISFFAYWGLLLK